MPDKIDRIQIKISGKTEIENPLKMDAEVKIELTGDVVKIEEFSNQDGSVNMVYTIKPISLEIK